MEKGNKKKVTNTLTPYEKIRLQRVQECKERMLEYGIQDISKSLTSLVESNKNNKRKSKTKILDNRKDGDYVPDLESSDEAEQEEETTNLACNKVTKKWKSKENQVQGSSNTNIDRAINKPVSF